MSAVLLAPPSADPMSLAEAKSFLRVEHADEDDLITRLVAAARAHVEARTRRLLMRQTWRITLDAWPPDGRVVLPLAPVRNVVAARVYDAAGAAHGVDTQNFMLEPGSAPARLRFVPWAVAVPGRTHGGIEIDVEAGYGGAASDVPEPLRQAIGLLVAHWYENRALTAPASKLAVLPVGLDALLAPYRVLSL